MAGSGPPRDHSVKDHWRGGAPETVWRRVTTLNDQRKAPALYALLMGVFVGGFAFVDATPPAFLAFTALLVAGAAQIGVGFVIGRWGALALGAVPILFAVAAAGPGSTLWTTVFVLMAFPGTPLIGAGVHLRQRFDERHDDSPDAWLYGEEPGNL